MVNNTAYEHGARKLKEHTGPDPSDDFSQEAAENKKPPNGGWASLRSRPGSAVNSTSPTYADEAQDRLRKMLQDSRRPIMPADRTTE